jgi:hypothetical protein
MPHDMGGPSPSILLVRSLANNFEALSNVIGRTIEALDGERPEDVERLHRAKQAADKGVALANVAANLDSWH